MLIPAPVIKYEKNSIGNTDGIIISVQSSSAEKASFEISLQLNIKIKAQKTDIIEINAVLLFLVEIMNALMVNLMVYGTKK